MSRTLPVYQAFLASLQPILPSTLPADEACPICKTYFREVYIQLLETVNEDTFALLQHLPFALPYLQLDDPPVRLPCTAGHVFGLSCLKSWMETSRQGNCPYCTESICRYTSIPPLTARHRQRIDFDEEEARIDTLDARRLITDCRRWTSEQRVRIQDHPSEILLRFMVNIAMRLQRPKMQEIDYLFVQFNKTHDDPLDEVYPERPHERKGGVYKQWVLELAKAVELADGQYPEWLKLLLTPEATIMHSRLSVVLWLARDEILTPSALADRLIEDVKLAWIDHLHPHARLNIFLELTVNAYVGRERLLTELKYKHNRYPEAPGEPDRDDQSGEGGGQDDDRNMANREDDLDGGDTEMRDAERGLFDAIRTYLWEGLWIL